MNRVQSPLAGSSGFAYVAGIAFVATFVLVSCDTGPGEPDPAVCRAEPVPGALMPLAVGNHWDLHRIRAGIEAPLDTLRLLVSSEFSGESTSGLVTGFRRLQYRLGTPPPETSRIEIGDGGVHRVAWVGPNDTLYVDNVPFPYPATMGTRSSLVRPFYDEGTWQIRDTLDVELIAVDEVIETPAGRFEAYVYKYYNPPPFDVLFGDDIYDYYVPGIGHVAQIWKSPTDNSVKTSYFLVDYCLFGR